MKPMRRAVCLCAWSTNQNKALTGAQFSCGADSLCAVLPAPAPFSSLFNHCLFTLSQELNELWLRALPGKPRPALPSVSPSLPPSLFCTDSPNNPTPAHSTHAHKHTLSHGAATSSLSHTHQRKPSSVLFPSASYLWQSLRPFGGWITPPSGHHQLFLRQSCYTCILSTAVDLLKPKLWRTARESKDISL